MKQRALITGANRGVGLATANALSAMNIEVLLAGRDINTLKQIARDINGEAIFMDMTEADSIHNAVEQIGPVDILINNAGLLGQGSVLDDLNEWHESMAVMVNGPFYLMHHLTPSMVARNYGRIVNVSSGWGAFSDGVAGPGAYGVAKAALNALTVSAARSLPNTVKVNALCPGWVRTRMGGMMATTSAKTAAQNVAWLATLDKRGPTGGFFRNRQAIHW